MSKNPSLPGADALFKSPTATKKQEPIQSVEDEYMKSSKHGDMVTSSDEHKNTSKHVNIITSKRIRSRKTHQEELIRYTLYFTPELLDKLEDIWMKLRRKRRDKLPKWKIVNVILQQHLGDLDYIENLLD